MNYSHIAFNFIMKEPDNKQCIDCGTPNPTYGSINNGVVVCDGCAAYHRTFGTNISWVKSLIADSWTDEEVMFIQISGNKRFISLMKDYNLSFNQTIEYKYSVVAADYYRNLLFCELNNREKPIKPDLKTGQMLIVKYLEQLSAPKSTSFFGKVDSIFSSMKEKISKGAKELDEKYDLTTKGEKALIYAKCAGEKVYEKGKELSQNPKVKEMTKKTEEGFNRMVEVTKKALNIEQNQNQIQQSNNMQYSTQSAQYYDSNSVNQPLIQNNQGYYQPLHNLNQQTNETQQQGNIEVNHPTSGSTSANNSTPYPKQI